MGFDSLYDGAETIARTQLNVIMESSETLSANIEQLNLTARIDRLGTGLQLDNWTTFVAPTSGTLMFQRRKTQLQTL